MRELREQEVRSVSGGSSPYSDGRTLSTWGSTSSECQATRQAGDNGWIYEITQSSQMENGVEVITVTATMTGYNLNGTYTNGTLIFKDKAAFDQWRSNENMRRMTELFVSGTGAGVAVGSVAGPLGTASGALLGGAAFVIGGGFLGQYQ